MILKQSLSIWICYGRRIFKKEMKIEWQPQDKYLRMQILSDTKKKRMILKPFWVFVLGGIAGQVGVNVILWILF